MGALIDIAAAPLLVTLVTIHPQDSLTHKVQPWLPERCGHIQDGRI